MTIIAATFKKETDAREALANLENIGIAPEQISFAASEEQRATMRYQDNDNSDDGAAVGAIAGGVAGAVFGGVLTTGAMFVPGLNIIVSGALAGALAGLATGAGAGGVLGALIGAGLSEEDAEIYETEIKRGDVFLSVNVRTAEEEKQVKKILKRAHAQDIAA